MTLLIRSWFIARWLGVTDKPPEGEFIQVQVGEFEDVWLCWPKVPKPAKVVRSA
jgi:hypothetical protein